MARHGHGHKPRAHTSGHIARASKFVFNAILFRIIILLEPPSQSQAPWDVTQWIDPIQNNRSTKPK